MACYHPLKAFNLGLKPNGKKDVKVTSYDIDYLTKRIGSDEYISMSGSPSFVPGWINITDYVEIPCGKCIGCRLARSADWANRCIVESLEHEQNCFVTLTYSNDNLPPCKHNCLYISDDESGEGFIGDSPIHPLVKRDLQLFMKRLRDKIYPQKVRFFACGEYGPKSLRPHYHLILFGYDFTDKIYLKCNDLGQPLYTSPTLEKLWGKGFVSIGQADWNACAYVARYIMKKQLGEGSEVYDRLDYEPEFVLMSRKPGIGKNYYNNYRDDIYRYDEICVTLPDGGRIFKPPRYFDRLYDIDCPEESELRKNQHIADMDLKRSLILNNTDKSYLDYLKDCEKSFHDKTKLLKSTRNKI